MTGNEKIQNNLEEYFKVCKALEQLNIEKERLRGEIQTEMSLNNMDAYTTDIGVARFKTFNRESIDKKKLKEVVAPAVLKEVLVTKEVRQFEIRSTESIQKSKTAFEQMNGGNKNGTEN